MKRFLLCLMLLAFFSLGTFSVKAQLSDRPFAGSPQKADDAAMVVYPNPARDVILIKSKNANLIIKSVTFYSILGAQVAEYAINKNSEEIRLDRLRPGKYLMRYVLSDNTQKVTQIVKQ